MSESIKVAVRIRPLVESEIKRGCEASVESSSLVPQVLVSGKTFSFNYVFDQDSTQQDVYEGAIQNLVKKLFKGYNVTVLAYGQTGSGKTHTMGSTYNDGCVNEAEMGVIPRAVKEIFQHIENTQESEYKVAVSFMELYMENLYDLLSPERQSVDIREDTKGIIIPKLTERSVATLNGTMECLRLGSSIRVTGATNMNSQSSRSHAVFTISIHQQKIGDPHSATTAKFNLVDLAGSERAGKTGAEGERFKEGVQINAGLLALGNVISALSEARGQVPSYRNSKLTRLLQDSLGGNSVTLMIACVSPADYNILETINTLRYASRAQNIKNKPVVNQDPKSAEIAALKAKVAELQLQLAGQGGGLLSAVAAPPEDTERIRELELKMRKIRQKLTDVLGENADLRERIMMSEAAREKMKERMDELDKGMREQLELADSLLLPESGKTFIESLKKSFSEKMVNLIDEQRRSEEEQKAHESMDVPDEDDSDTAVELRQMDDVDDLRQMDEYVEKHTDKQSKLNDELKEITKELQFKEQRFLQYAETKGIVSDTFKQSIQLKIKYEKQITELEKEKEELMNSIKQLQVANKDEAANIKQSELLKKNAQIDALKKKLEEQSNIVRQKENAEKKVQELSREISSMKQAKVRLIKLMKAETEQHKAWVKSREREAAKLRENERKRTNEMHRMAAMHSKQQNVSKRKLEQAVAANKRLKEALLKQKVVRNTRDMRGNKEQVQEFVAHELEVLVSTMDAEQSLQLLIEDRAQLTDELAQIRRQTNDQAMMTRRQQIEQEIELRSAQIADLQQKLADTGEETKSKSRWDAVATMADAKVVLSCAIRLAAEMRREQGESHQRIIADQERLQEQLMKTLVEQKALRSELARQKEERHLELVRLEKEHQEALQALLNNDEKENILEENNILREKLDTIISVTVTPVQRKRRSMHREFEDLNMSADGKYVEEDDPSRDPDWRKTPLAARLRELKSKNNVVRKRNVMGEALMKCGCMMKCDSKRCICFRANGSCGDHCTCLPTKCQFKLASITYTSDSSPMNQTYVKEEANTSKKRKVDSDT